MVEYEWCGKELEKTAIELRGLWSDAERHYFCSEECLSEWLVENAEWDYIDVDEIELD